VAGYFLGQVSFLRDHIELLLLAIVLVSVLPPGVEIVRHWVRSRRAPGDSGRRAEAAAADRDAEPASATEPVGAPGSRPR